MTIHKGPPRQPPPPRPRPPWVPPAETPPTPDFAIGDLVRLKSGGALMTVRELNPLTGPPTIVVDWLGDNGAPYRSAYVEAQLTKVKSNERQAAESSYRGPS